jgi:hypothetical protein
MMSAIDYNLLKNNLKKIVYKIFDNYKKEHNIRKICGMALFSDEDAMSISMAVNTYEHLENNINENPEFPFDFKYNPEEWHEIIEDNELDNFNKTIGELALKIKRKQSNEHRNNIYKISVEILNELKGEQYFKDFNDDFLLLFSLSNFEYPEMVIEYNKKYNNKTFSEEYEKWINEMEEGDDDDDE